MTKADWGEILCGPGSPPPRPAPTTSSPRGELTLKGFDAPIEAFTLTGKRQQSTQREFSAKELVGRAAELAALEAAVAPIFATPACTAG